jgi:hypothetical protein
VARKKLASERMGLREARRRANYFKLPRRFPRPKIRIHRLRLEIAQVAYASFGQGPSVRIASLGKQLRGAELRLAKAIAVLRDLPPEAWACAGISEEEITLERLEKLRSAFEEGASFSSLYAKQIGERGGGPTRDKTLATFVNGLIPVFNEAFPHIVSTHQHDPGKNRSKFDTFVHCAYLAVLGDASPQWSTLSETILECLRSSLVRLPKRRKRASLKMAKKAPSTREKKTPS